MMELVKHLKCKKCGEQKTKEKYVFYNSLDGAKYRNVVTDEWLTHNEHKDREDRFYLVCSNCGAEGNIDDSFEAPHI